MTLPERILLVIIDPNIAYILFTLGTIGLIAELYHPGTLFPGITGAISLILAFVAFGNLPVNWAGVLLLILAFALFVAELYAEGIGFLAVGGLIAFVLGSLMLFAPARPTWPGLPALRVSPWLIMSTTTAIGGFFLIVLRAVVRTRHEPVATGIPALIGKAGITLSDLAPFGTVRVDSETWSAVADPGPISSGEPIRVVDVDGVTLRVTPARRR
jgi:membrane-bound serine protease (ClpP class)